MYPLSGTKVIADLDRNGYITNLNGISLHNPCGWKLKSHIVCYLPR